HQQSYGPSRGTRNVSHPLNRKARFEHHIGKIVEVKPGLHESPAKGGIQCQLELRWNNQHQDASGSDMPGNRFDKRTITDSIPGDVGEHHSIKQMDWWLGPQVKPPKFEVVCTRPLGATTVVLNYTLIKVVSHNLSFSENTAKRVGDRRNSSEPAQLSCPAASGIEDIMYLLASENSDRVERA